MQIRVDSSGCRRQGEERMGMGGGRLGEGFGVFGAHYYVLGLVGFGGVFTMRPPLRNPMVHE